MNSMKDDIIEILFRKNTTHGFVTGSTALSMMGCLGREPKDVDIVIQPDEMSYIKKILADEFHFVSEVFVRYVGTMNEIHSVEVGNGERVTKIDFFVSGVEQPDMELSVLLGVPCSSLENIIEAKLNIMRDHPDPNDETRAKHRLDIEETLSRVDSDLLDIEFYTNKLGSL